MIEKCLLNKLHLVNIVFSGTVVNLTFIFTLNMCQSQFKWDYLQGRKIGISIMHTYRKKNIK